jgi:lipoprotein-releasing system ATP-binding protein
MSAAASAAATDGRRPVIEARNVTRILAETVPVTLVRDINLAIYPGDFMAITGPSGSGKSSLLYLLGLLDLPTAGDVFINGRPTHDMDEAERAAIRLGTLGFVFQFHFLLEEFTLLGNTMVPMRQLGRFKGAAMRERAEFLLDALGLANHMHKRPSQLSGGQRQRVAVARALANDPPVLLADEPTGSLDSKSSEQVFQILADIAGRDDRAVIAVTHDLDMAERMDRRVRLFDGRIVADTVQTGKAPVEAEPA